MKKKEKQKETEVVPIEEVDKSVISSEEVGEVISGDEVALAEQMEKAKALTIEQQETARKNAEKIAAEQKAQEEAKAQEEKKIQEEARKRIEAAKIQEEAKKAAELKAQEEAKKAAEQKVEQAKTPQSPQNNIPSKNKNNDGPSTFKRVMAAFLFLIFFAIVYFLPEISSMISKYQESKKAIPAVTDGVSTCKLSKTSENLDINMIAKFYIINSKLYKLEYVTTTTGDKVEDEDELKKLNENCKTLKLEAGELEGVTIACSLNNGTNTTTQKLDFEKIDAEKVNAAFVEAGGIYPEFKKNDNIDEIESKMQSSGYECSRQ